MRPAIPRPRIFFFAFVVLSMLYMLARFKTEIQTTLHSATRPLAGWTAAPSATTTTSIPPTPSRPSRVLPHLHAEDMFITDNTCALHGWQQRDPAEYYQREMWDTIILDGPTEAELDLVEVRLFEQMETVDKVFVLESNRTVNGTPKPLYFKDQLFTRFETFQYKIVYHELLSPPPYSPSYPSPAEWEAHEFAQMTSLLRMRVYNTILPPMVLFTAPDEIIYPSTLRLLRECVFPSPMHFQMRQYLYSFEWPLGLKGWRPQVRIWGTAGDKKVEGPDVENADARNFDGPETRTEYSREMAGELMLADAGWHCSHCLPKLQDLLDKVRDERGEEAGALSPHYIQEILCEGNDIFNVFPDTYSRKELLELLSSGPSKSGMGLPKTVLERGDQFKYLLPGGCFRED